MEEWPERPSLRFLIHWALRREAMGCDGPANCENTPDDSAEPCERCPVQNLDVAMRDTPAGHLLNRVFRLRSAIKMGVQVSLDVIGADEFDALQLIEQAVSEYEKERIDAASGK